MMKNQDLVAQLRKSPWIREKQFGCVSSFNPTREAWDKDHSGDIGVTARGLYVNTGTGDIIARGYDKFFNVGENAENELSALKQKLEFPLYAYKKENGYLGLISYNQEKDSFFFATESMIGDSHAKRLEEIFYREDPRLVKTLALLRKEPITLVVEVIDPANDPYIIEYDRPHLVVLDMVYNELQFSHVPYEVLALFCDFLHLKCKQRLHCFMSWDSFERTAKCWDSETYTSIGGKPIEGFVLEDRNGYMFKYETAYYRNRSAMRRILCGMSDPFLSWYAQALRDGKVKMTDDVLVCRNIYKSEQGKEAMLHG